jgi:DNA-binding transcriptional regulator YiaG
MTSPTASEVRNLRASLGLSQPAMVARLPGVTLRAWRAWEHGARNCPPIKWAWITGQLSAPG